MASVPRTFLLTDVRVFDGHTFIESGHVLVEHGKIARVAAGAPASTPHGVATFSRPGHTVMPGLIDCHVHAVAGDVNSMELSIRFGVTTVMDMANEHPHFTDLQKLASDPAGDSKYADFKYCGYCATTEGGWPANVILHLSPTEESRQMIAKWPKLKTVADIEPFVKQQQAYGASYIKLMHEVGDSLAISTLYFEQDMRREVVKQAHAAGLKVVAHALAYRGTVDVLEDGVDGLTHNFVDAATDDRYVELYKRNKAHCNPTLATLGSLTTEGAALQKKFADDELARRMGLSEAEITSHCACIGMGNGEAKVANAYAAVRALYQAGVPIVAGSDAAGPTVGTTYGLSLHQEMYLMAHGAGMKPVDVLKGATSTLAERFGFDDRGTIAPGKRADLLLVAGDPRESLADERSYCLPVRCVWRNGAVVDEWKEALA